MVLAMLIAFSTMAQAASDQVPPPGNRLDLPGVIVTPLDLHAVGITGFGADHGVMYHTVEEVLADAFAASRVYLTIADVPGFQQLLNINGWLQYHEQRYGMTNPAETVSYAQVFAIGIEQYGTAEGAAAAFATLTSEVALAGSTAPVTRQPLAPVVSLGDQAVIWSHHGYIGDPTLDRRGVTVMVRSGTLIVSISQIGFDDANQPDHATVERAMLRQLGVIAAVQESGTVPSCLPGGAGGICAQRLTGDGVHPEVARYIILDGIVITWDDTTPDSLLRQQAEATEFNVVSAYRHWNYLDGPSGSTVVHHMLYRLADGASAATYHGYLFGEGAVPEPQSTITVSGATAAATFSFESSASNTYATYSHALVGNVVVVVTVDRASQPVTRVSEALLSSQVACMQAGHCLVPVAPSPELLQAAT